MTGCVDPAAFSVVTGHLRVASEALRSADVK